MKKVLLASDSVEFLNQNTKLLQERGFQLFTSTTAAESLKLHGELQFDLILADLELEDMSGNDFCTRIREGTTAPLVPVILICNELSGSMRRIVESGANAMLLKPVDQMQLLETVGRFTGLPLGRSRRVVLKVIVISREREWEFVCFSHDISSTGILIETEHMLDLGIRIVCQFALPGMPMIETKGEVVRSLVAQEGRHLYGIRFIELTVLNHRMIDNYIASIPSA